MPRTKIGELYAIRWWQLGVERNKYAQSKTYPFPVRLLSGSDWVMPEYQGDAQPQWMKRESAVLKPNDPLCRANVVSYMGRLVVFGLPSAQLRELALPNMRSSRGAIEYHYELKKIDPALSLNVVDVDHLTTPWTGME